jgi:hypothetical protein
MTTVPLRSDSSHRVDNGRWMGVGRDQSPDARVAGEAAVQQAVAGREASLLLVFCAHTYDLPALLTPMQALLPPGALLVGCTTDGQLALPGLSSQDVDAGVVVIALGGEGLEVAARAVTAVSERRHAAGAEAASVMVEVNLEHQVCLLLADGLTREQHEIVRGSYSVLGAFVPIIGGCSADDTQYIVTYQFLGDHHGVEVITDGLVGVGIASSGPIGIGIGHGWSKFDHPFLVTNSSGGRIYELDSRPALDVYLECLGLDRVQAADEQLFRERAFQHPLGLSRRTGEDIRVVHAADLTDGSLWCLADVPQGAIVWQMRTNEEALIRAAADSRQEAVAALKGEAPLGLVVFDCGARKVMLGASGVRKELDALGQEAVPTAGFYTFGEIARTHGSHGMHHLTVATLALS